MKDTQQLVIKNGVIQAFVIDEKRFLPNRCFIAFSSDQCLKIGKLRDIKEKNNSIYAIIEEFEQKQFDNEYLAYMIGGKGKLTEVDIKNIHPQIGHCYNIPTEDKRYVIFADLL